LGVLSTKISPPPYERDRNDTLIKVFLRHNTGRMLKKNLHAGCSKTLRYKAPDNLYPPAGRGVSRTVQYAATTRDEGNAVDGRFSATC
jgi:hypothetical protein